MFARVPGANTADDTARLREIDVANENQHDHSTFISHFVATHAYSTITTFINHLNTASRTTTLTQAASHTPQPPAITALLALLTQVEAVIAAHPPLESGGVASRFGNAAFRDVVSDIDKSSSDWLRGMIAAQLQPHQLPVLRAGRQRLVVKEEAVCGEHDGHSHEHETDGQQSQPHSHTHALPKNLPAKVIESLKARGEWPTEHADDTAGNGQSHQHTEGGGEGQEVRGEGELSDSERVDRVVSCIAVYFNASFGDRQRIDYGTGHELNFVCFLYTLTAIHFIPVHTSSTPTTDHTHYYTALALVIFPRYLAIMRRLQSTYLLEPAGSRGVWGLDDYSFLPFLLGSSQLIHHPHIRPRSVRYPEVLEAHSGDYLYCDAVRWVLSVKSVSFAEHSPMLNDITGVKGGWEAVNGGLWRMYEQEVLRKYPIVQHFIFTDLLSPRLVKPVERQCCTAAVSSVPCDCVCCRSLTYVCVEMRVRVCACVCAMGVQVLRFERRSCVAAIRFTFLLHWLLNDDKQR